MDRRMSLTTLDDEDESVRIAVRALDDMRNGALRPELNRKSQSSSISTPSTSNAPSTSQASTSSQRSESQTEPSPSSPAFVSRMTSIPLLKSALTVYEQGKASSRVVKYGADLVESSVRTLSRPVIDRLPVDVNQLDEFACRQLDRLDRYRRPSVGESSSQRPVVDSQSNAGDERGRTSATRKTLDGSALDDSDSQSSLSQSVTTQLSTSSDIRSRRGWKDSAERGIPSWIDSTSSFGGGGPSAPTSSRIEERALLALTTPTPPGTTDDHTRSHHSRAIVAADVVVETNGSGNGGDSQNEQQVAQRSRWQAVLLEAGGLSAALSEDSMRRLKYVLQWLQYATAHIDAQILILREFTASLQEYPPDAPPHARRPNPISEEHMRKLTEVRKDIVQTVRQVVDVVSKYAGGALPEPARNTVRGFILKLPQRWASKASSSSSSSGGGGAGGSAGGAERDSVTAAASGAAGSARRSGHQRRRGERGTTAAASSSSTLDPNSPLKPGLKSGASSAVNSPAASPRLSRATLAVAYPSAHSRLGEGGAGADGQQLQQGQSQNQVSHGAAIVAAQRILSLATESLDMMRGVTGVVKDSLDRAELWISRLRTVGLQRAAQEGTEGQDQHPPPPLAGSTNNNFDLPPSLERRRHRRNSSSQFSDDLPPSPFFSGASTAWNSSIPSTPVGPFTPMNTAVYQADGIGMTSSPSGFPNIASMTLSSRYNTPKSVRAELPDVEEMLQDGVSGAGGKQGEQTGGGEVRIMGVDEEEGRLVRESKMEVDPV